jgi:peroxiredoxin
MQVHSNLTRSSIRRSGLVEGELAPSFTLQCVNGDQVSLTDFNGRSRVLMFSDLDCAPCNALLSVLIEASAHTPDIQILVVSRGSLEANRGKFLDLPDKVIVVLQKNWEISRRYATFGTPVAYFIDEEGVIRGKIAEGPAAVIKLLFPAQVRVLLGFLQAFD